MKIALLFFLMLSLSVLGQSKNSEFGKDKEIVQINYQQEMSTITVPSDSILVDISIDSMAVTDYSNYESSLERLGIFGDVIKFIGETIPSFSLGLGILGQVLISLAW